MGNEMWRRDSTCETVDTTSITSVSKLRLLLQRLHSPGPNFHRPSRSKIRRGQTRELQRGAAGIRNREIRFWIEQVVTKSSKFACQRAPFVTQPFARCIVHTLQRQQASKDQKVKQ